MRRGAVLLSRQQHSQPAAKVHFDRRSALLLAVCCVAQFMVILDLSIVNVALPSIQSSLSFSASGLQWVVDAYAIAFAGFLMFAGRVNDHLGQRKTFVTALVLFSLTSLLGGAAPDRGILVAARALQGLSGALMAASSLAIVTSSFAAGPARHKAIALWGAMNGAGGAAGTLLGGVLTQGLGWRWVLLINPPIGIAAAIVAVTVVAERRRGETGSFDLAGAVVLTSALSLLVLGGVNAGSGSWLALDAIGPVLLGVVLLIAFVFIETRIATDPLVPFRSLTRPVWTANAIVLLFSAALFPMWYVSSLYLQQVLGLSPLATGLTFLPMALTIMLSASRAGALVGRFGVRAVLTSGLLLMTAGMLIFARIRSDGSPVMSVILPGVLTALGIGLAVVSSTIAATQSAGPEKGGLVSGLVNTSRQTGGGIGIALLISVGTLETAKQIGSNVSVSNALTDGYRTAYLIGAALVGLAAIVTATMLPRPQERAARVERLPRFPGVGLLGGALAVVVVFACLSFGLPTTSKAPIGAWTPSGTYRFVSEPRLHPPKITVEKKTNPSRFAPVDILLGNFYNLTSGPMVGQSGPLILDQHLQPVWFHPVGRDVIASNLEAQRYKGKPVLTWWQGVVTNTGATERGEDVVVNDHYHVVARLKGTDGWILTMHSLVIDGHDAWVTANKNIRMNLRRYGGAVDGVVTDSAAQEYNLRTGRLVRSWDALKHIPLSDSYALAQSNGFPWDAYHINSINLAGPHTLLVSMRNTWAAYKINTRNGHIEWTLGGKHSSFRFGRGARFEWQHDVSLLGRSEVTLFDDHCCQISGAGTYVSATGPSRGLVLKLDHRNHIVTIAEEYSHGKNFDAAYMGSTNVLPDGDVLVGWGSQPDFSEYSPSGKLLFDAALPTPDLSYRATAVSHWVGIPLTRPKGAARASRGAIIVYASWNGATRVKSWRVLAGPNSKHLVPVATKKKYSFETSVHLRRGYRVYRVEALDASHKVIGTSHLFKLKRKI